MQKGKGGNKVGGGDTYQNGALLGPPLGGAKTKKMKRNSAFMAQGGQLYSLKDEVSACSLRDRKGVAKKR